MKEFCFTIRDELGIHARPAGLLVKEIKSLDSAVTITKGDKSVDALRLIALMGLGIKQGDTVKVSISGGDEETSLTRLKSFFENHL